MERPHILTGSWPVRRKRRRKRKIEHEQGRRAFWPEAEPDMESRLTWLAVMLYKITWFLK